MFPSANVIGWPSFPSTCSAWIVPPFFRSEGSFGRNRYTKLFGRRTLFVVVPPTSSTM